MTVFYLRVSTLSTLPLRLVTAVLRNSQRVRSTEFITSLLNDELTLSLKSNHGHVVRPTLPSPTERSDYWR